MPTYSEAPIVSLAGKIVTDINAATWTPSGGSALVFTARHLYSVPEYPPTDTALRVDVLAAEEPMEELADRGGSDDREFLIAIGVQKKLTDKTSVSEVSALINFVEALRVFYELETNFTVSGSQVARCVDRRLIVPWSPIDLDQNDRFFSVLHLTFRGWYD